jgi:hypothetical protein
MRVLYTLLKLDLDYISSKDYSLELNDNGIRLNKVSLCDNPLFKLIRVHKNDDVESTQLINLVIAKKKIHNKMIKNNSNVVIKQFEEIVEKLETKQFVKELIFIKVNDYGDRKEIDKQIEHIYRNGITVNKTHFIRWGKSSSMTRHGIIAFIQEDYYKPIHKAAMMDINPGKVIIAKWEAYFNLLLFLTMNP